MAKCFSNYLGFNWYLMHINQFQVRKRTLTFNRFIYTNGAWIDICMVCFNTIYFSFVCFLLWHKPMWGPFCSLWNLGMLYDTLLLKFESQDCLWRSTKGISTNTWSKHEYNFIFLIFKRMLNKVLRSLAVTMYWW